MVNEQRFSNQIACPATRLMSWVGEIEPVEPWAWLELAASVGQGWWGFWSEPEQSLVLAAVGVAEMVEGDEPLPYPGLVERCQQVLEQVETESAGAPEWATGPLLLGGMRFDPCAPRRPPWKAWPGYRFVLPRWMLTLQYGRAWLTMNRRCTEDEADGPGAAEAWQAMQRQLAEAHCLGDDQVSPEVPRPVPGVLEVADPDADRWMAAVGWAAREIARGEYRKVVLARSLQVRATSNWQRQPVLAHLLTTERGSYRFGFGRGRQWFVGASPERLVRRQGDQILVTCLAGSMRRGQTAVEDEALAQGLLRDAKNRVEHALVVDAVASAVRRVADRVQVASEPVLYGLPNVWHLYTPVSGHCGQRTSVLSAATALHPTPAVGGWPQAVALEKIRHYEGFDRGWYGAPVGWVDAHGHGEFAVAIRSALLESDCAWLYTGCGVVGDSDPVSEMAESRWKLRTMLGALAVDGHGY